MWDFSDFAKKAQELQEQALASTSSGFSLNLDAMQKQTEAAEATRKKQPPIPEEQPRKIPPSIPPVTSQPQNSNATAPIKPRPPTSKGKLQVPAPKATAKLVIPSKKSTASLSERTTPSAAPLPTESDEQKNSIENKSSNDKNNSTVPTSALPNSEGDVQEEDDLIDLTDGTSSNATNQAEPEKKKALDIVDLPDGQAKEVEDASQSAGSANPKDMMEPTDETRTENNGHGTDPPRSTPAVSTTMPLQLAEPPEEQPKRSLLVLASTLDRKSINHQNFVFTVLQSKKIPYETIDIMDDETQGLKDDLIQASGIPSQFPQFFLVDLSDGTPTFWGLFDTFQQTNDDGRLQAELCDQGSVTAASNDSHTIAFKSAGTDVNSASQVEAPSCTLSATTSNSGSRPPEPSNDVMEHFTLQLNRLEQNHQAEITELEKKHEQELRVMREFVNQSKTERKDLEQQFQGQLQEKDIELRAADQRSEGLEHKIDTLNQELERMQAALASHKSDMGKTSEENLKHLRQWEKKVMQTEEELEKARENSKTLEKALEESKNKLASTHKEHEQLRENIKEATAKVNKHRAESRGLELRVDEIKEEKQVLAATVERLEFQLSDREKSGTERHEEIEQLRSKLSESTAEIEKLNKIIDEKDSKSEKALSDYKRKTQSALAMANSRAAAAVQSKEEAELEARAARSTADAAMERVAKAESAGKAAEEKAKASVSEMQSQRDETLKLHRKTTQQLEQSAAQIKELRMLVDEGQTSLKAKTVELDKALADVTREREHCSAYQNDLTDSNARIGLMREEIKTLKEKVRVASSHGNDAVAAKGDQSSSAKEGESSRAHSKSYNEDTLAVLENELNEANQFIAELKEALNSAVEQNDTTEASKIVLDAGSCHPNSTQEASPLFYAMERQAELNVARTEINRLANLLSDAQAEKTEALDAAESMRRQMEEAEARLNRFEKLGKARGSQVETNGSSNGSGNNPDDSGAVNIEYLKNIMLRYLNAGTLGERKALVPVIGAVLCLTPDEQKEALSSLEGSASIGGVGSTLLESFSGNFRSK